jgi:hypothetical protein
MELIVLDSPPRGDKELTDQTEPVNIRVDRTDAIGESLRQHGENPIRKVDRVASLLGFTIKH